MHYVSFFDFTLKFAYCVMRCACRDFECYRGKMYLLLQTCRPPNEAGEKLMPIISDGAWSISVL